MPKIIKKFIRYLLITIGCFVALLAISVVVGRTPVFQSFLVKKVSSFISGRTGMHISIGKVSYTYFNKLVAYDILIKDQNNDTLLSAQQVSVKIKEINPALNRYRFGTVDIYQPDFRMITDTSGVMNLRWYLDIISGNQKGGKKGGGAKDLLVSLASVDLYDASYRLINRRDTTKQKAGLIDFSNLKITGLSGNISDFTVNYDSVHFRMKNLAFNESTGFTARDFNSSLTIKRDSLFFNDIKIITDSSIIMAPAIYLTPVDSIGFADFINKVKLNIVLDHSSVSTSELSHFAYVFKGIDETFNISGHFYGTISEFNGRKAEIKYGTSTRITCDFDLSGLPVLDNTFAFIEVNEMRTTAEDIEHFRLSKKSISLPKAVHDMGKMTFRGNFTGFTTDFVSYGTLRTEKGSFTTDVSFRPDSSNVFKFKGLFRARDVDMATITGNPKSFGKMWCHADMDGFSTSLKHFSANINGAIDSIDINSYTYRNVELKGKMTENIWDGNVTIRDENIDMKVMGRFDFSADLPEFDFSMYLLNADLYRLNLMKQDTLYKAQALVTASFKGNNIDNLDGTIRLDNSTFINSTGKLSINDFYIRSTTQDGVPLITLNSDFMDAEVRGPHNYASLEYAVKSLLSRLFPSKFKIPVSSARIKENNFIFTANFKDINSFNQFFNTGISVADSSSLHGLFHPDSALFLYNFRSRQFGIAGCEFMNINADININGNRMNTTILSDVLGLPDHSVIKNLSIDIKSHPDTINLSTTWDNKDQGLTTGSLKANGYVSVNDMGRPDLKIYIQPTTAYVAGQQWKINPAILEIDSSSLHADNILISNGDKYFKLDGYASANPEDKLRFVFDGINLAYLNKLSEKKSEGSMEMTFGGIVGGYINVSDVKRDLRLESDIKIDDFTFNKSIYGKINIGSEWDNLNKEVSIEAYNDLAGAKFFDIKGKYTPNSRSINLTAILSGMPLNIINPLIKSFASDLRGLGSGKINLYGRLNHLNLIGAVKAKDASLKVDFLQTRYYLSDSIRFTRKGIEFKDIKITDDKKNQGTADGILYHQGFKDISLDFTFNIKNMMVLNTKPKDSQYFYGTAYATGIVKLKGPANHLVFDISARTGKNTYFFVPLNSSASVADYPYILFIDRKQLKQNSIAQDNMFEKKVKSTGIDLNIDLEVTPDAEAQMILDSKIGDIIKGSGSGKLNISMKNNGPIKMAGDYVIEKGDYLFTMGNVLNKKFTIENGGTISWNGGLTDADLNLKAKYTCETSLYDLFPEEAYKKRIRVDCILNLSGKLFNPVVGFDINLPMADDETREYLKMAINNEEEMSKQFLYLLVMNSFYPDPALFSTTAQSATQGTNALGVTTTEMLSNQFSNWLSQISNDFDIGFVYRPSNEISTQQVEAAFSTQLLNNKVTLNGNVDVGGKSSTKTSNVTTDFTLEYSITDRLKFKAFNRSNDNVFYETAPYTQGFGLLYRHEFDKFRDLLRKSKEKDKKKQEKPAAEKK
jgi:hypothetical protein